MLAVEERFWAKVDKSGDCWLWMAEYAGDNLYVRPPDGARICRTCVRGHVARYRNRRRGTGC